MKKFEYRSFSIEEIPFTKALNELGLEGWEVIHFIPTEYTPDGYLTRGLMKREIR